MSLDPSLASQAQAAIQRADREMLPKVECPKCGHWDSRVKEGRPDPRGYRVCKTCKAMTDKAKVARDK